MDEQAFQILVAIIAAVFSATGAFFIIAINRFGAQMDRRFEEINDHMSVMSGSVGELNQKIAVIITVQDWHMKEIEQIKTELRDGRNV